MIEIIELSKFFDKTCALDGVGITFRKGGIYALVGSNGSGKSTLMRNIAGVYAPDGGQLLIDGEEAFDKPPVKQKVFFLPDTPSFFKNATVLSMADFYRRMYPNFDMAQLYALGQIFPIGLDKRIDKMSKGMQRQAALMLALSSGAEFLLLDEAFDGLDPVVRGTLKSLLMTWAQDKGTTTVIASHNLRELEDLCDHVTLLHKGKAVCSDDLESLRSGIHKVQAAFKALPSEGALAQMEVLKVQRTGSLLQMVIRGEREEIMGKINALEPIFAETIAPSLEEIFIFEMEVRGYDIKELL